MRSIHIEKRILVLLAVALTLGCCQASIASATAPILEVPTGALDPGFAAGGVLTTSFGATGLEEGHDAATQTDEKIVVLITAPNGGYLTRYLPNGELDTSFGSGGTVATPTSRASFSYLAIDNENRIVVIGDESTPNWEAPDKSLGVPDRANSVVYRFLPNGELDQSFGIGGKVTIVVPSPEGLTPGSTSTAPSAVLITPGNGIVVGGEVGSICAWTVSPGFSQWWEESGTFVARLNANGSFESQFGSAGLVSTHGRCKNEAGAVAEGFGGLLEPSPKTVLTLLPHPEDKTWRFRTYSSTGVISETPTSVEGEYPLQIVRVGSHYLVLSDDSGQSGLLSSIEVLRQFSLQGVPDPSFGASGRLAIPTMECQFGSGCLTVLPDGHILVAGTLYRGQIGIRRYLADGSVDDSFGTEGYAWAELTYPGEVNIANKLLTLQGKLLVVGAEQVSTKGGSVGRQAVLTLFQADGGFSSNLPRIGGEEPLSPLPIPAVEGSSSPKPSGGGVGTPVTTATRSAKPSSGSSGTTAAISSAQISARLHRQLTPSKRVAKIATLLKSGVAGIPFKPLEAGTVVIKWYQIRKGTKPVLVASGQQLFYAVGTGIVDVRLNAVGARLLRRSKQLKLTAKGVFTPEGGKPISSSKVFVLHS